MGKIRRNESTMRWSGRQRGSIGRRIGKGSDMKSSESELSWRKGKRRQLKDKLAATPKPRPHRMERRRTSSRSRHFWASSPDFSEALSMISRIFTSGTKTTSTRRSSHSPLGSRLRTLSWIQICSRRKQNRRRIRRQSLNYKKFVNCAFIGTRCQRCLCPHLYGTSHTT